MRYKNAFDIIFVNPPLGPNGFPFGIGILSSVLTESGYNVGIVDASARGMTSKQVVEEIAALNCHIVGLTGLWSTYQFLKEVSLGLREIRPEVFQIAGGWWASVMPEFVTKELPVNVVVRGEADNIISDLVQSILTHSNLSSINGLSYIENGKIFTTPENGLVRNLDKLPLPDYQKFDTNYYTAEIRLDDITGPNQEIQESFYNRKFLRRFTMYSGRGCYGKCAFCSAAGILCRKYSPEYVVNHLKLLHEKYQIDMFYFGESLTLNKRSWVKKFCNQIIKEKLKILFRANARGDFNIDYETALLLRKAGCDIVSVGFESGSQMMLNLIGKKTTLEGYYHIVDVLKKVGIKTRGTFVLNMPGETEKTISETIKFLKQIKLSSFGVTYASPYPGTALFDYALSNGYIKNIKQLIEDNPGRGKGREDFDAYYAQFNFNKLPKQTLIDARREMLAIAQEK